MTVSVIMDSAIWGRYHVPQNVFLVCHAVAVGQAAQQQWVASIASGQSNLT